jgi:hypothetical protein
LPATAACGFDPGCRFVDGFVDGICQCHP